MGFSLSPMHNSTVSPENSNGRVRLGNADDLLVFMSVAVGELGTPGRGHIHATAAQRNVRSNPLLKAHLGDVASRKRVGLVCSSESAAQGS